MQGYLNILFNREQLNTFQVQKSLTEQNKERTEKLIRAGSLPQSDVYTIDAQLAQDEVNVITAQK